MAAGRILKSIAKGVLKGLAVLVGVLVLGAGALVAGSRLGWLPAVNAPLSMLAEPVTLSELQQRVEVPPGFTIDYFAQDVPRARFMRFTPTGDLLVTTPRAGGAIQLVERDADGDGHADGVRTLIEGLRVPHGIDFREDWLYIAETHRVVRVRFDAEQRRIVSEPEVVVSGLPEGGNHSTRTLRFGPDGGMYVSVGSSCNVCEEDDERRAAMLRYEPDGSGYELFATGLRNSVGFDFHPETGELYATDNGRDLLGDDFPPCELNRVERGGFYGWPHAHGDRVPDPDFGEGAEERIRASIPPVYAFGAHTAPLGMTFYRGAGAGAFPDAYRGAIFVAQHGSWNRSTKIGYRVLALRPGESGASLRGEPFAVGFERDEDVIGRPADVIEGPDGALYVSDDFAGAIYRIAYTGE